MASYMYNPSQKVTDILSNFFEFDPSELELGIWSGDLQLKNVKLREESIHPLLNRKANKPHTNPLKKAPLHMKLVSGTVGSMRIRIPWKRLVWGQGAVQLEISDVMIVLSLQSREETEEQRRKGLLKERKKKQKDAEDKNGVSKAYREAKQRRLQEAEKRLLQGQAVALYLENIHRKNSVAKEAAKAEALSKLRGEKETPKVKQGKLDKWLKNTGSDLFWRFFAGIQGSISKARIVVVQDGVEVGCIIQSIEVVAGKDGIKLNVNMNEDTSDLSEEARTAAEMTPPDNVAYESAYTDGEHVDKMIKQQGLGLFIRKEVNMAKVPQALRFSSSVSADDYILRPVDLDLAFSFFYPYPPERRKKKAIDNTSQQTPTTVASTSAAVSVADSTSNASSSRRRGKRDHASSTVATSPPSNLLHEPQRGNLRRAASFGTAGRPRAAPGSAVAEARLRAAQQRRLGLETPQVRPGIQRMASLRSHRSSLTHGRLSGGGADFASVAHQAVPAALDNDIVPQLDCRITMKEIRIVFTTRHYELFNFFLSTVSRMKNGRPDQMIRSTPKETNTALFQRKFLDITSPDPALPTTDIPDSSATKEKRSIFHVRKPDAKMLRRMLAPITGVDTGVSDDLEIEMGDSGSEAKKTGQQVATFQRSIRSQVVVRWWKYSIGAILWEVQKRKHLATNFREMYISFDWNRQRHKRKEYIELYIAHKLNDGRDLGWPFDDAEKRAAELLKIEDELPIEQILLYRSIARSIRVRGLTEMPDSILELNRDNNIVLNDKKKKKKKAANDEVNDLADGEETLLSMVQNRFKSTTELRKPEGLYRKFRSSEGLKKYSKPAVVGDVNLESDLESGADAIADDEALSTQELRPQMLTDRRHSSGYDSEDSEVFQKISSLKRTPRSQIRRNSLGNEQAGIVQTGNFYASAAGSRRDADGRTIRTLQRKDARSKLGQAAGENDPNGTAGKADDRMKLSFAFSVKLIELMVVEEDFLFDMTREQEKGHGSKTVGSDGSASGDYFSGDDQSSSDGVSDLSVLTDDQRFFNETGQAEAIAEEEDDDEGAKLSSTDFLRFGLPEDPILRLTINSLGCSLRGRSGGRLNLGVLVRSIGLESESESHLFSMGSMDSNTPIAELNFGQPQNSARRKSLDSLSEMEFSMSTLNRTESWFRSRGRTTNTDRAISLIICKNETSRDVQCDLGKVALTCDLTPFAKLLKFHSKSEIKFPDRIVEKSSRDVARKFMVYKTTSQVGPHRAVNAAIRVHGFEARVPFADDDAASTEHSNVDMSQRFEDDSLNLQDEIDLKASLVFSAESVELFSGTYVEDIAAEWGVGNDLGASRTSMFSSTAHRSVAQIKRLEMIDVAELTAANDSFTCKNTVATMSGIHCHFETIAGSRLKLIDVPVDVETLVTTNETSLLETALPKNQIMLEVSPLHIALSKERLDMLTTAKESLDYKSLDPSPRLLKKIRKPDPPRIDILAPKILHSVDLNCKRVQLELMKDIEAETINVKMKEIVMEECLTDFLSIVSCFDLSLPNEEALSSAMQVCIGRLVGLGLSDDEAWGCANAARINFLEDVSLMRKAQADALMNLSSSLHDQHAISKEDHSEGSGDHQEASSSDESDSNDDLESAEISISETSADGYEGGGASIEVLDPDNDSEDDDSADSADIVETTLHAAVEKTVSTFAPLLQTFRSDTKDLDLNSILVIDLPLGFSLSTIKLFYDAHHSILVNSLVATSSAGVELLTLVPPNPDEDQSLDEDFEVASGYAISFSRYDLDTEHDFGKGGLPMGALAVDEDHETFVSRQRSRFDDIEIGELEFLFSSRIYEEIFDEVSKLRGGAANTTHAPNLTVLRTRPVSPSIIMTASSISGLFTTDELVPFSRLTLEKFALRNNESLKSVPTEDEIPSWLVVAETSSLHNLSPEGQFYPDFLTLVTPAKGSESFPFQIQYFKSPDPWSHSSRLIIDFKDYRLFLLRQFIHELLQFFVYDREGVGRLKKKYSKDVRDKFGNQKPPLLWSVRIQSTSVICPRSSTSSDMAAFEVEKAFIAVSYIPESFAMPTETAPFHPSPASNTALAKKFSSTERRGSVLSTSSEYYECIEAEGYSESDGGVDEPVSSFSKDLKKRIGINLDKVRVFTVVAPNPATRDAVESSPFRFFYEIDGRADDGKQVYARKKKSERQPLVSQEVPEESERFQQRWEEISTTLLDVEVYADYAPHMRIFIGNREKAFSLDARMSQLCLLLSVWDNNMQEQPAIFPFPVEQVAQSASPPQVPETFPAYSTEEYVAYLEDISSIRSEICCIFKMLSLRCTYDPPGHFSVDPGCFKFLDDPGCSDEDKPGVILTLEDANIHIINDLLNVRRIGIGACFLEIIDERRHKAFQRVLSTSRPSSKGARNRAWADTSWGLRNDIRTLSSNLPMPVIFTVFMTPGWSLINVGAESLNGVIHDLSWIWVFLDYFKSYYTEVAFGNIGHQAQRWAHRVKNSIRKSQGINPTKFQSLPGVNVDFRLWLCRPVLCVPSSYESTHAPCLRIDSQTGLWYRYKSIKDLSSQEVSTTDLNLHFTHEFRRPENHRADLPRDNVTSGSRALVEGLSFGLRYDCNNAVNHKDVSVLIPFAGEQIPTLAVSGTELEVQPIILPAPIVCKRPDTLTRRLGLKVCEITCIVEVLPIVSRTMMNFFKGPADVNEEFSAPQEDVGPVTFSVAASISDLRIFAIDPVLGAQLPVAVASVSSLQLTATKFEGDSAQINLAASESAPEDMQVSLKSIIWIDYFKLGMTRSWEPLVEPFDFLLMFEKSRQRGQGFTFEADNPFHINLSGAFLQGIGETVESFSVLIKETFGEKARSDQALKRSASINASPRDCVGAHLQDSVQTLEGTRVKVLHEIPKPLKKEDRAAFSLRNLTGQKIRVHQQTDRTSENALNRPAVVTYLHQAQTMGLTFAATISVIKNLAIVEVPYPGLPNSSSCDENEGSLKHAVDLQIPGFRWIQGIKVDTFGRHFETLSPRTPEVQLKLLRDWRLKNAMMLLTEVGLDSGGRLVTVRSLFEIRNNTTHPIKIVYNPNPRARPVESVAVQNAEHSHDGETSMGSSTAEQYFVADVEEIVLINPGASFQIPTLLLETSLQMTGSHLGCLWICPDTSDKTMSFWNFFTSTGTASNEDIDVTFSSRPIQIAKLVHESSVIFQRNGGADIGIDDAKSGVQVSCPTKSRKGGGRAPFCYAIEVGRSPLVNANKERNVSDRKEPLETKSSHSQRKKIGTDKKLKQTEEKIHGPVAYSLSVNAPLVIVNLLPEGGRFELMHAIRKTVVWYADLKPGQQVPVHSVGLDAPLLLLVNLGFCRTPVGGGALVHHGADSFTSKKGEQTQRLKLIGKAALKGTKQIGKTLTSISDTPDRRGQGKFAKLNAPQFYERENKKRKSGMVARSNIATQNALGLDTETSDLATTVGKIHSVESVAFSENDIASETVVVDGVGQRLTLNLENVRGGGGQRRISLFCPFWIVNTTEHSLRYKQEKAKSFVAGTVVSPRKDGSKPVDGSNRNYRMEHKFQAMKRRSSRKQIFITEPEENGNDPMNSKTIFAGTPGALATSPGHCDLDPVEVTKLIDKELSLERMAQLAFMFNFHEEGLSIGHRMLCVQLHDGSGAWEYSSEWSRGFSLDSVGFSQIVAMNTREGRAIELSAEVNVAPGFLSSYTKIVRFVPRHVLFNQLERPIRLWQDSSIYRPAIEERTVTTPELAKVNKDARKWRYDHEDKTLEQKINQYETLFGRPSTILDRSSTGVPLIPDGTTAHRSALYIKTVGPGEIVPFLLPDTRAERQLRVDLGGIWNVSSSFSSDLPGEHCLTVSRAADLRLLSHVSTRAAPKYKIVLPPPASSGIEDWDGELGVFFETDWGADKRIIVKGTKRGRFAYNHTDIHVGDELLRIDGVSVAKMNFVDAMKAIKDKMALIKYEHEQRNSSKDEGVKRQGVLRRIGGKRKHLLSESVGVETMNPASTRIVLTFRTLEERLRKLHVKASLEESKAPHPTRAFSTDSLNAAEEDEKELPERSTFDVEVKSLNNTMFVVVREHDEEKPAFRVQNRSINHIVFYRQRGCEGHPWNFLFPGESLPYAWEEPMKSKKLTVRVAAKSQDIFKFGNADETSSHSVESELENDPDSNTFPEQERQAARVARLQQALSYQYVNNEERGGFGPAVTVRLEEIGYRTFLSIPQKEIGRSSNRHRKFLNCEVDTDGGTRLLIVSDETASDNDKGVLKGHLETLKKEISYEEQRIAGLSSLQFLLSKEATESPRNKIEERSERIEVIEEDAMRFVEDFSEDTTISSRHQVVIEVIEAVGLNASDLVGNCNPYCEVFLKGRSKSRQYFFQKRRNKRKTYFIEKSVNPKWADQAFVFDVPEEAVRVTRGHHLLVKLRNFRLVGGHPILGQTAVHLGSLRSQQELLGWYPLSGRSGRSDSDTVQLSDASRGSIKLRVQWVYTTAALIDYFLMLSHSRLDQLKKSEGGMAEQLSHAIDSEERKREGKESINATGRITKLAKLEKKKGKIQPPNARERRKKKRTSEENTSGKLNLGINSSLTLLKGTLKASRNRYLQALYFQTAESKRNRQTDPHHPPTYIVEESLCDSTHISDPRGGSETMSPGPGSLCGSVGEAGRITEQTKRMRASPYMPKRKNKQSLDDFFASSKSPMSSRSPVSGGRMRIQSDDSPRRKSRASFSEGDGARGLISHRKLSLDIDEHFGDDDSGSHDHWRSSMIEGMYSQSFEWGMSDMVSVSADVGHEARKMKNTQILLNLGFAFHEHGSYFHREHLPYHFRRSLAAGNRSSVRLYRSKFAVGGPTEFRFFKSAQAAGALFNDPELEVTTTKSTFRVSLKKIKSEVSTSKTFQMQSKSLINQRLQVPSFAPLTTKTRSAGRVETLHLSRSRFERAAARKLAAVLNPGGRLIVRPITALNLPDGYNGMTVKLRYGAEILLSENADAKVTPRWGSLEDLVTLTTQVVPKGRGTSLPRIANDPAEIFMTENDLQVRIEPQQTSGVMKISVVADRVKTKSELGVLEIPLGEAIAACLDPGDEENGHDATHSRFHSYVRWFPLMSPRIAIPVEGDLGSSSRPTESEKPRDSMFQQYFTPCIQLALIWWPDVPSSEEKHDSDGDKQTKSFSLCNSSRSRQASPSVAVESYVNLDLSKLSLALIDSQRARELLSFSALEIDARYSITKTKTRTGLVIGWIQLDHQDPRAREPVVLAPTPTDVMQPTLQFLALKDNLRTKSNIVSYDYIGVALREMDLTVEESWIFEIWEFLMNVKKRQRAKRNTVLGQRTEDFLLTAENCFAMNDSETDGGVSLLEILEGNSGDNSKSIMYIEQLILGLVKVNLSYVKGKKQSYELTDQGARALKNKDVGGRPSMALAASGVTLADDNVVKEDVSEVFFKWSQHAYDEDHMRGGGYNLPGIIAAVFPSVSDAPIRLQGKVIDHAFESKGEIFSSIKNFYVNETLKQVYKIIGSLDFVGNPTILFSSFVSGVRDLVAAPTSAFLKSPTNVNQVGIAVGKGTLSLFSHSASGIFGFAAKMSATAGQAAAILSLDSEFSQWHRDRVLSEANNLNRVWKRRGIQSVPEMLARPVGDILLGVAMGASGMVIAPYKGLKKGGGAGFARGVAIGIAGVVAKPLVGVLDSITHFSATIHDVAKSVNVLERRYQPALRLRLPYIFGPMNVLSPFDAVAVRSVYLLRIFPPKAKGLKRTKRSTEIHVHSEVLHMEPGVDTYAIATTLRVVLIRLQKDASGSLIPALGWEVLLFEEATVASRISDHGHNGVALTITRRVNAKRAVAEVKGSNFLRSMRAKEAIKTPTYSSALSMDSGFSDLEDEDEDSDDEFEDNMNVEDEAAPKNEPSVPPETEGAEPDLADPTFDYGATKKGDAVVKWYTVLAEYQHRRQLTALHNAVSALVGNFDAIINDPSLDLIGGKEGVSTFGIFTFEKSTSDHRMLHATNANLIMSLESLPWMHETVFAKVERLSPSKQLDTLTSMRRRWSYATDLEGSKFEGGPVWLVETRARAMHSSVSMENHIGSDMSEPSDPIVQDAVVNEKIDKTSAPSPEVFTFTEEWVENSQSDSASEFSLPFQEVAETVSTIKNQSLEQPSIDRVKVGSDANIEEMFHSLNFEDTDADRKHEESWVSGTSFHEEDDAALSGHQTLTRTDMSGPPSSGIAVPSSQQHSPLSPGATTTSILSTPFTAAPAAATTGSTGSQEMAAVHRMNRMEVLMEQLVIMSAQQQMQQQGLTVPALSQNNGGGMAGTSRHGDATDALKQEVAELRSQVQARAAEDDVLRNEISKLRQQLADRRADRNAKRDERTRLLKIPDVLRFGGRKDEAQETVANTAAGNDTLAVQTAEPQTHLDSNHDESFYEFYETPLQSAMFSNRPSGGSTGSSGGVRRRSSLTKRPFTRRLSGDDPTLRERSFPLSGGGDGDGGAPGPANAVTPVAGNSALEFSQPRSGRRSSLGNSSTLTPNAAGSQPQPRLQSNRRPSADHSTQTIPKTPTVFRRRDSGGDIGAGATRRMSGDRWHQAQVHFH